MRKERSFEIMPTGKFIVSLEDLNKYLVLDKLLITLEAGEKGEKLLCIYEIKQKLTKKDILVLDENLELGLKRIKTKLCENGPAAMTDGNLYYGDIMAIKKEGNKAFFIIF